MQNKIQLLVTLFSLVLFVKSHSQEINVTTETSEVTVYRTMARETRQTELQIKSGYQEIVLTGITDELMDQSLQVSVKGEATLLSAMVRKNYFPSKGNKRNTALLELINDTIKTLEKSLRWIVEERAIYSDEMVLVTKLMDYPSQTQTVYKPEDLDALADIHRKRMMELRKQLFALSNEEEMLNVRRMRLQGQIEEMGDESFYPMKEIVLSILADQGETIGIKVNYLVNNAGWIPTYDIHADNSAQPIQFAYKAKVIQQTGVDWKNVSMKISTANPALSNNRPLLQTGYVDYVSYRFNQIETNNAFGITNMMQAERVPEATGKKVAPSVIPQFEINPNEKDILVEFNIDNRQTILSSGKEYILRLKENELPATYRYHAVPKMDQAAFLIARITDYGDLNLLTGDANVFYGDTYVGQVNINPAITGDTLLISLGREDRIIVKRTRIGNMQSKKLVGEREKMEYEYLITVRNNKQSSIELEILDQVPKSRNKEIEVKINSKDNAEYDPNYGKLLWNFKLGSNQSKKIKFGYTVEFPEGKQIQEI